MMPTSGQLLFDMLQNAGSVALVAHVSPDMDALGASLGARELLRQGFPALERVDVFCQDPVPESYAFLDLTRLVLPPERGQGQYDLCIRRGRGLLRQAWQLRRPVRSGAGRAS